MATDWGGSGDKDKGGGRDSGGSIPCPIVVAGIIAIPVLIVKLFKR